MLTREISHAKWLFSTILDPLDSRFTITWLRLTYVSSKRPLYLKRVRIGRFSFFHGEFHGSFVLWFDPSVAGESREGDGKEGMNVESVDLQISSWSNVCRVILLTYNSSSAVEFSTPHSNGRIIPGVERRSVHGLR